MDTIRFTIQFYLDVLEKDPPRKYKILFVVSPAVLKLIYLQIGYYMFLLSSFLLNLSTSRYFSEMIIA